MPDLQIFRNKESIIERTINQRIADMNTAFGNPKGDYRNVDIERIRKQCVNVFDEFCELIDGLYDANPGTFKAVSEDKGVTKALSFMESAYPTKADLLKVRDALCDIQVFASGAQHLMGVDADEDMGIVIDGVMTRFIKSPEDKQATIEKHEAAGVKSYYFEGTYPTCVMKSAADYPDAPKGKFLKSASFSEPVFLFPDVKRKLMICGIGEEQADSLASITKDWRIEILGKDEGIFLVDTDIGQFKCHIKEGRDRLCALMEVDSF